MNRCRCVACGYRFGLPQILPMLDARRSTRRSDDSILRPCSSHHPSLLPHHFHVVLTPHAYLNTDSIPTYTTITEDTERTSKGVSRLQCMHHSRCVLFGSESNPSTSHSCTASTSHSYFGLLIFPLTDPLFARKIPYTTHQLARS